MIFSVLSIIFSFVNQISRIFEEINDMGCQKFGKNVLKSNIIAKLKFQFPHLKRGHKFANFKFSNCLETALKSLQESQELWVNRSDVLVSIDVFYIEDAIKLLNTVYVYFKVEILSLLTTPDDQDNNQINELIKKAISQQLDSFNNENNKLLRQVKYILYDKYICEFVYILCFRFL